MTNEQKRTMLMLEHVIFIARGIERSQTTMPDWVRTDAQRIADKAEAIKYLQAQTEAGYRVPTLPGMEDAS